MDSIFYIKGADRLSDFFSTMFNDITKIHVTNAITNITPNSTTYLTSQPPAPIPAPTQPAGPQPQCRRRLFVILPASSRLKISEPVPEIEPMDVEEEPPAYGEFYEYDSKTGRHRDSYGAPSASGTESKEPPAYTAPPASAPAQPPATPPRHQRALIAPDAPRKQPPSPPTPPAPATPPPRQRTPPQPAAPQKPRRPEAFLWCDCHIYRSRAGRPAYQCFADCLAGPPEFRSDELLQDFLRRVVQERACRR
jgi:hypothetical protein